MKKKPTTDAKKAAANDKPENEKTEKAKAPEPERYTVGSTETVKRGFFSE